MILLRNHLDRSASTVKSDEPQITIIEPEETHMVQAGPVSSTGNPFHSDQSGNNTQNFLKIIQSKRH